MAPTTTRRGHGIDGRLPTDVFSSLSSARLFAAAPSSLASSQERAQNATASMHNHFVLSWSHFLFGNEIPRRWRLTTLYQGPLFSVPVFAFSACAPIGLVTWTGFPRSCLNRLALKTWTSELDQMGFQTHPNVHVISLNLKKIKASTWHIKCIFLFRNSNNSFLEIYNVSWGVRPAWVLAVPKSTETTLIIMVIF